MTSSITMKTNRPSEMYKINILFWKITAIWTGRNSSHFYKYYVFVFQTILVYGYIMLLTLNLFYTPRKIITFIPELVFFFTEIAVLTKVIVVMKSNDLILEILEISDSDTFVSDSTFYNKIITDNSKIYRNYWNIFCIMCHTSYISLIVVQMIKKAFGKKISLPVCSFYFLSPEIKDDYIFVWFGIQALCVYIHMIYNINIDTFLSGIILLGISHFKLLNNKLANLKAVQSNQEIEENLYDELQVCLKQYDLLLKYCKKCQEFLSLIMFSQFAVGVANNCICLYAMMLPLSLEKQVFLLVYSSVLMLQIFMPGLLGSEITRQAQEVSRSIYNSDWIDRSAKFKTNMKLLVERSLKPVIFTGWKMYPLSLSTFTAIMRTGYSFFTILRNMQQN